MLCPYNQGRIDCFDDYLALWVNVIEDRLSRKRDYVGKRSYPTKDDLMLKVLRGKQHY